MKIAIESNDGVTLNSPFTNTNGYLVCEIGESGLKNSELIKTKENAGHQKIIAANRDRTVLKDCRTIISRGMDRSNFLELRKNGIDVFITFKSSVRDAIHSYMRENILEKSSFH